MFSGVPQRHGFASYVPFGPSCADKNHILFVPPRDCSPFCLVYHFATSCPKVNTCELLTLSTTRRARETCSGSRMGAVHFSPQMTMNPRSVAPDSRSVLPIQV